LAARDSLWKAVAQLKGWRNRLGALKSEIETLRDRHRELLAVTPQILFITDANGHLVDVGQQWLEQVGISEDEALGFGWMSALHPDDLEPTQREWLQSVATGEPLDHEYRLRMASGEYVWFRVRAFPGRDGAGKIRRWYGSAEDINARKSIDVALRESEAFARSILNNSPDCILVMDNDGALQFMNKRAFSALNVSELGRVKEKPWTELWPESVRALASQALRDARDGRSARFLARLETTAGALRFWDVSVTTFGG
jgi:PAS domain S-box-containing protein